MPRHIVKLAEDKYIEWSSVVDAPVTHVMNEEACRKYVNDEERWQRIQNKGTSMMDGSGTVDSIVRFNRAGKKESQISLEEILEEYK